MTDRRICYSCLFFRPTADKEDPDAAVGQCRRRAPEPGPAPAGSFAGNELLSRWPIVRARDWCGQWRSYRMRPAGWPVKDRQ